MGIQLFKAFGFPFRLTVADAEQDDDGGNVHPRQRIWVFVLQFAVCNQRAEDACMVGDHPIHIAFGKQFGKLGGTELLQRHHPAELADGFIVQRIKENLSDFFNQQFLRDVREHRNILLGILYMD